MENNIQKFMILMQIILVIKFHCQKQIKIGYRNQSFYGNVKAH